MGNLRKTIEFTGKNFTVEMVKIIAINLLLIAILMFMIFTKVQFFAYVIFVIVFIVCNYVVFSSYYDKKKQIINERNNEFIEVIGYFEIFNSNNKNVYQCFNEILPYCSEWMKSQIETLIQNIDNDKTVQPFINFARKFSLLIIESIMISIYQMVDEGNSKERTKEFSLLFSQISQNHKLEIIAAKNKSFDLVNAIPLFGAGYITILLTFAIMAIMGELINVI